MAPTPGATHGSPRADCSAVRVHRGDGVDGALASSPRCLDDATRVQRFLHASLAIGLPACKPGQPTTSGDAELRRWRGTPLNRVGWGHPGLCERTWLYGARSGSCAIQGM